ncbi:unnamed protein product [Linum trigynum]|uniref:Uncharacterized protein n=1 Tax=Linum trigynum TaxID=586398 RepID=A0AAV2E7M8_9ROSI
MEVTPSSPMKATTTARSATKILTTLTAGERVMEGVEEEEEEGEDERKEIWSWGSIKEDVLVFAVFVCLFGEGK